MDDLFEKKDKQEIDEKCLNCNADLVIKFKYCPQCGTKKTVLLASDSSIVENEVISETQKMPGELHSEPFTKTVEQEKPDFSEITKRLDDIYNALTDNEHQNQLMSAQYQEIQKLRGNFYADLLLPLISDIIEITDDVKRISRSVDTLREDNLEKIKYFVQELNAHIEYADGKLNNRSISAYISKQQEDFDERRHIIVEMVQTNEKGLHHKVAESVYSGYCWKISDSRNEIIRKEKVKVFEYKELSIKNLVKLWN